MKGANVLPFIMQLLPSYLDSQDWIRQHTGIITLGIINEGCHDLLATNLSEYLGFFLRFTTHENPRLRWAACTTIGLACSEFEAELVLKQHSLILPAIMNCLGPNNMLKVQTQAACCLENYLRVLVETDEEADAAIVPYAQTLLPGLFGLMNQSIQNQQFVLLTEVLNSLRVCAMVMEGKFGAFYDQVMPGLKMVVSMTPANIV
jgi:hypothetical protein